MKNIEFIGKSLLITTTFEKSSRSQKEEKSEKILVIGDLHLGFEEVLRERGVMLPLNIFEEVVKDFNRIFEKVGNVDKVILLGDLKHEFGRILMDERKEIGEMFNYLRRKSKKVVVIKGNHDAIIEPIVKDLRGVELVDYYLWKEFCFLHGDRDFKEIYGKKIRTWIVGHAHPAITLQEEKGSKKEKYKCFLTGRFKGKEIIIAPSFFEVNEGTDVLGNFNLGLVWKFNLKKFKIKIIEEDSLRVLDFGKLGKL